MTCGGRPTALASPSQSECCVLRRVVSVCQRLVSCWPLSAARSLPPVARTHAHTHTHTHTQLTIITHTTTTTNNNNNFQQIQRHCHAFPAHASPRRVLPTDTSRARRRNDVGHVVGDQPPLPRVPPLAQTIVLQIEVPDEDAHDSVPVQDINI
jgi:hypothetical protein